MINPAFNQTLYTGLKLPDEIRELFDEAEGARICRDQAIDKVFGARRAIRFAIQDIKCRRKAWDLVMELWPQTRRGNWVYHSADGMVYPEGDGS